MTTEATGAPVVRRALVSGSGWALGSRICMALAADGAWVAGLDVSADAAAATTERLTAAGAKARHGVVDLLDFGALQAEIDKGGLHSGQHASHATFMDTAGERILVGSLKIHFH